MKALRQLSRFKTLTRFLPIEKTLNLFKYSKMYLKQINMNENCIKYYKILKSIYKENAQTLFNDEMLGYILRNELSVENIKCLKTVRDYIFRQDFLYKKIDSYQLNSENLATIIKKKNKNDLKLIVESVLSLSEDEEKSLFEVIKTNKISLSLFIKDENKIISKLLKEITCRYYSLNLIMVNDTLFKEMLSVNNIHSIEELSIIDCNIENENRKLLFGEFLPKCNNLKSLILTDFPQESEKFGNFLENCKYLENLNLGFVQYKSLDTLNYMFLNDNQLKNLKLDFSQFDKDSIELDFSFIKYLQNLENFELQLNDEGEFFPKNLIEGLNNIKTLKSLNFDFEDNNNFKIINGLSNPSLESLFLFCEGFDFKIVLENNKNLRKIDMCYFNDIGVKTIKFPEKLETMILKIKDTKILTQLFKQIQIKPLPLIELDIRVEWLLGRISYNTFHEMADAFKHLTGLKRLYIKGLYENEEDNRRNIEWLKNLKYLNNLEYFEIMYYGLTIEELEIFLQSIQNLEFLYEIHFYDNNFSLDKVIKLLKKYKLPPQLRFFNIFSQCYKEEKDNENDDDKNKEEKENNDEDKEENINQNDDDEDKDGSENENRDEKKDENKTDNKNENKEKDEENDDDEKSEENENWNILMKTSELFGYPQL